MTEELYFNTELRNCLDAAVFSDCGENDQWNWWYQRLHQAHDASVDRVTDNQRIENAKMRELCAEMFEAVKCCCGEWCTKTANNCDNNECGWHKCYVALRELGIEVEDG